MEVTDVITFTVGVSLGLFSIALGIFAIWFSYKLSENSNAALESVKDLARETKVLVDASLSQQKDFSNKMLDSILEQNKFGNAGGERYDEDLNASAESVTSEVSKILEIFEQNISESIEKTIRKFNEASPGGQAELKTALASIKDDIGKLSQVAPVISSVVSGTETLRQALQSFRDHPAHYLVLYGVIRGGLKSYDDKSGVALKYNFPGEWEEGVENLINKGVLESTGDGEFDVPENYKTYLSDWASRNKKFVLRLKSMYEKKGALGPSAPTPAEVMLGQQFEH